MSDVRVKLTRDFQVAADGAQRELAAGKVLTGEAARQALAAGAGAVVRRGRKPRAAE